MHMDVHSTTLVPRREQDTTIAAVVLHVLEGVHHVWNEAEAEGEAKGDTGPDTRRERYISSAIFGGPSMRRKNFIDLLGGVSSMIANSGHPSFPAAGAIRWGRAHTQIRNRCRGPELTAVILVLSHAATTHLLTLA